MENCPNKWVFSLHFIIAQDQHIGHKLFKNMGLFEVQLCVVKYFLMQDKRCECEQHVNFSRKKSLSYQGQMKFKIHYRK